MLMIEQSKEKKMDVDEKKKIMFLETRQSVFLTLRVFFRSQTEDLVPFCTVH